MHDKLHIEIQSFSYKKGGIPTDHTENGGGFVFDCRGILNPGRIERYKEQTGRDTEVAHYLEENTLMPQFLQHITALLSITIDNYIARDFKSLKVNFGCTGGQHRSVYCADYTAKFIEQKYPMVAVTLRHNEQPQLI